MLENPGPWPMPPQDRWFNLKIIALSLIASQIICFVVFAAAFRMGPLVATSDPLLNGFALLGVLAIPVAYFLPRLIVDRPARTELRRLLNVSESKRIQNISEAFRYFQSRTIMGMAILNGAAIVNLMLFFTVGFQAANLLAFLVVAPAMFFYLPTPGRWWNWLDNMTQ